MPDRFGIANTKKVLLTFHPTKRDPLSFPQPLSLANDRFGRLLANTRLAFAALILLAVSLQSSQLGLTQGVPFLQTYLIIYLLHSAALRFLSRDSAWLGTPQWASWIDLFSFGVVFALSNNPGNPAFLLGFFFVIVIASWTSGRVRGLVVTSILCGLLTIAGMVREPVDSLHLRDSLLRSVILFCAGYGVASLAGWSISLKRQVKLLEEITTLSNPRLGFDRTLGLILERLRSFYDADLCLLIRMKSALEDSGYVMRRADRTDHEKAMRAEIAGPDIQERLLALPPQHFVLYRRRRFGVFPLRKSYCEIDVADGIHKPISRSISETIADMLDVNSLVAIPVMQHEKVTGRLYLGSKRLSTFSDQDADFLRQVLDRVLPALQNVLLVDRLASDAAEQERQKIACDIHDSVIQPYLGVQLGLASIREKLKSGADAVGDLDRLIELTEDEISHLRHYASGITRGESEPVLLPAVRRFAEKFSAATGISVGLNSSSELRLNDRLAVEVLQMVHEGLSNIRRHTTATRATVEMGIRKDYFTLRIANEGSSPGPANFYPRSIAARTAALGGRMQIDQAQDGTTSVVVVIPL